MASSEIECSISALGSDIRQIQNAYNSVVKNKDAMLASVNSLNGLWSGQAHDVFLSAFNSDYEQIGELCKTIEDIINCLDYARGEYAKCEQQVSSTIASINI